MTKYIFAYHSGPNPPEPSPEIMEKWTSWIGGMGSAVVDGGAPVSVSKTVDANGTSDGGGANPLSGYTFVETDSMDAACKLAEGCPALETGGSVEVAECVQM